LPALSAVIAFENVSSGMGTSAYAAFMASITDKRFTATQYALLTSLMGIPRVLAAAPTGYLASHGLGGVFHFLHPDRHSRAAAALADWRPVPGLMAVEPLVISVSLIMISQTCSPEGLIIP
jgi:hypothetical protein